MPPKKTKKRGNSAASKKQKRQRSPSPTSQEKQSKRAKQNLEVNVKDPKIDADTLTPAVTTAAEKRVIKAGGDTSDMFAGAHVSAAGRFKLVWCNIHHHSSQLRL